MHGETVKFPHYVIFSTPCYVAPLRPNPPQHLILKHTQSNYKVETWRT
jgi:hypothetical protein